MRFVGLFLLASVAFAQGGGTISGNVSDDDGAAVPKVKVQAKKREEAPAPAPVSTPASGTPK